MHEILIVGGGPAGLSAAMTARSRGKDVLVVSGARGDSGLWKAGRVMNYPGVPNVSGAALLETMARQAEALGAAFTHARVQSILPMGKSFGVAAGAEVLEARAVILACGVAPGKTLPGETRLLGRGVSTCATCDGMLYRGRRVAVVALSADAPEEADFLRGIGCDVRYFEGKGHSFEIRGEDAVTALAVDGEETPCDAVFVLRGAVAAETLLPGLRTENGHIVTDAAQATSVPGVFAAGDCTGAPYQIAPAVGEGNVAALSAVRYLRENG